MNLRGREKVFPPDTGRYISLLISFLSLIARCLKDPPAFRKTFFSWFMSTGEGVLLPGGCWELAMLLLKPLRAFLHEDLFSDALLRQPSEGGRGRIWGWILMPGGGPYGNRGVSCCWNSTWWILRIHLGCQEQGPKYWSSTFKFWDIFRGYLFCVWKIIPQFISVLWINILFTKVTNSET